MFNFIEYYLKYHRERESPDIFWYWSAIATLAAVMRDNVYLEVLDDKIFPNLYMVLMADSGIYRKDAPCKAAARLIQEIGNTRFIGGRNSIQSAIKELGESYENHRGDMVSDASAVLFNAELSSLLVKDEQAISLLTTLYDYHENWTDTLISRGRVELEHVCISLLSASNSKLFGAVYTDEAIEGGLLGRTLIVKPTKKRKRRSLFEFSKNKPDKTPLIEHLKRVSKIKGPIRYTPAAEHEYNVWYREIPDHVFEDRIGFGSRLGTHVFKVSLAIAAAREDFDLLVEITDVQEAIISCQSLRGNYKEITIAAGISSRSKQTAIILQLLLRQPGRQISRAALIQRTIGDLEGETLDSILTYLEAAEMVVTSSIRTGVLGYTLTPKAIAMVSGETEEDEGEY